MTEYAYTGRTVCPAATLEERKSLPFQYKGKEAVSKEFGVDGGIPRRRQRRTTKEEAATPTPKSTRIKTLEIALCLLCFECVTVVGGGIFIIEKQVVLPLGLLRCHCSCK
jgi:hypothetical protein